MSLVLIDGENFEVGIVNIIRKARISKNDLGTTLDGKQHYQALGTYYDYEVTFNSKKMNVAEYDRLYDVLTAPVNKHSVTMPFGQTTLTFDASLSIGSDSLVTSFNNFKKWGSLKVTIESLEPQRVAQ